MLVPTNSSCHKEYQSSSIHFQKLLAGLKFQTEVTEHGMAEWQTGQEQYGPNLGSKGHTNIYEYQFLKN